MNGSRYVLFGIGLAACNLAGNYEASRPSSEEPWLEPRYGNETDINAHSYFSIYFHFSSPPAPQLKIEFQWL
jgi:hypothetical protein